MSRRFAAALLLASVLAAGCNRVPASEALGEAEQAIEAGRPQLEAYAPEDLATLRAAVQDARARLDEGRYTDALRLAQKLPGRVQEALARGQARKGALDAEWGGLSARLPGVLRGLELKLADLRAKARPAVAAAAGEAQPPALGEEHAQLAGLVTAWRRATAASSSGRMMQAVEEARAVATGSDALAARLGFSAAQAAALASAVAEAQAAAAAAATDAAATAATPLPAARPAVPVAVVKQKAPAP